MIIINADRGDYWGLLDHFRGRLGGRLGFGLLRSSEFGRALGTLGEVNVHRYNYHVIHDSIADATEFIGRQVLEINDEALLERHRPEFEAAARERLRSHRVVFGFEADVIVVQA